MVGTVNSIMMAEKWRSVEEGDDLSLGAGGVGGEGGVEGNVLLHRPKDRRIVIRAGGLHARKAGGRESSTRFYKNTEGEGG